MPVLLLCGNIKLILPWNLRLACVGCSWNAWRGFCFTYCPRCRCTGTTLMRRRKGSPQWHTLLTSTWCSGRMGGPL